MIQFGNIAILGDSYSTYEGYIPKGYNVYYGTGRSDIAALDVNETWWQSLADETGSRIQVNNSWSGSAIARITYGKQFIIESSFPERVKKCIDFSNINTLFIFGGTNDSWADSPIGAVKYADIAEEDLNFTLPSFCFTVDHVKTTAPHVRIVAIVNSDLKDKLAEGMAEACDHYGIDCVRLQHINKQNGHPDKLGMKQIKDQIIGYFDKSESIDASVGHPTMTD